MVKGPMGATIATLYDLGFNPLAPDRWITSDGIHWKYSEDFAHENAQFYKDLLKDYVKDQVWKTAAEHRNGAGLAGGVDFTVIHKHMACLEKSCMYGKAGLLRKAAAGALWPKQRAFAAGVAENDICPRCRKHPETEMHRIWQCEANDNIVDPIMDTTNHLAEQAIMAKDDVALWTKRYRSCCLHLLRVT